MSQKKKKNIYIYLGKVIFITLLIILCIRTFLIEPYTISSPQMETLLIKGDRILIDKTAYGVRLPMTILTIPFTFDNIFGHRSYSTKIEAPYKRIFEKEVSRNDIVLFNNSLESEKPLDKRSLIVSRCVALPGDTILVENGLFMINNRQYITSPDVMEEYTVNIMALNEVKEIMEEQDIPLRNLKHRSDTVSFVLNRLEAFIVNESLQDSLSLKSKVDTIRSYRLPVPFRGKTVDINSNSLTMYRQIIELEQGDKIKVSDDMLFINGKEQNSYTFGDDYYWMLSDNKQNSTDSRTLGFIPFSSIIGKARLIWYSSDSEGIKRERCFTLIN
ncbi:signal peptidase I [Dysgonomonas sp. 521]|uniref:signal peptidase I n=1 Tax=Dysgonomonas sp. 521 TaxID=2302932 RepID=UPI0013D00C62|nr:signal peptidase I [Dysgonomonas sp. 521]NDV96200.1 signal peptidase I [Dysgonomonas sp. 521]